MTDTPSPSDPFEVGSWQRMLISGRRVNLLNPRTADITISDIALGLSRTARWNGQTSGEFPFSVAQHSLFVEDICRRLHPDWDEEKLLIALLHDAPEYLIGDLHGPFKRAIGKDYKNYEKRIEKAIHEALNIDNDVAKLIEKEIKHADNIAAYYESTMLNTFSEIEAEFYFGKPEMTVYYGSIAAVDSRVACQRFIDRFVVLDCGCNVVL